MELSWGSRPALSAAAAQASRRRCRPWPHWGRVAGPRGASVEDRHSPKLCPERGAAGLIGLKGSSVSGGKHGVGAEGPRNRESDSVCEMCAQKGLYVFETQRDSHGSLGNPTGAPTREPLRRRRVALMATPRATPHGLTQMGAGARRTHAWVSYFQITRHNGYFIT